MELSLCFLRGKPNKLFYRVVSGHLRLVVLSELEIFTEKGNLKAGHISPKYCLVEVLSAQTWNSNLPTNPKQLK